MKQFDLISDIHLDFWMKLYGETHKQRMGSVGDFVKDIIPTEISDVLVIAGDLGHDNKQNFECLKELKKHYKHILLVAGNHDYYLVDSKQRYMYSKKSMLRLFEMRKLAHSLEGVHYLDGDIVTIEGVYFGGVGMWYDFSYSIKNLGYSASQMYDVWYKNLNDSKHIYGLPNRPLEMFKHEKEKLDHIIDEVDVIITHVGPDSSKVELKYEIDPVTGCYFFDGEEYFSRINQKIWCFGHTHVKHSYMRGGCWLVNNSLGYPTHNVGMSSRIVNIPLE